MLVVEDFGLLLVVVLVDVKDEDLLQVYLLASHQTNIIGIGFRHKSKSEDFGEDQFIDFVEKVIICPYIKYK